MSTMEKFIEYVSQNNDIINDILSTERDDVIEAIYKLFLNYNCCTKYLLISIFHKEYKKNGIFCFRHKSKIFSIVTSFLTEYGGKFDVLAHKICDAVVKEKAAKSNKNLKNALIKSIDIISDNFLPTLSDTMIDFCSEVCITLNSSLNTKDPQMGQKMICSFIIFNIISPKILKVSLDSELIHIQPFLKLLNEIALGDKFSSENFQLYTEQHEKFKGIVARAFLTRRETDYKYQLVLPTKQYDELCHIIITYFRNKLANDHLLSSIDKNYVSKYNRTFIELLKLASINPQSNSWPYDFKYFVLWSSDEVNNMISAEKINNDFFIKWKINGETFLQLDQSILHKMGMTEDSQIDKILSCISNVKSFAICDKSKLDTNVLNWNIKDMCVWLILSDMSFYKELFIKNEIDGRKLLKMTPDDYLKIGINVPNHIQKLDVLKN